MQSYNLNRLPSKQPTNVSCASSTQHHMSVGGASGGGGGTMDATISGNSSGMSPPDFDFNIPCRYFKSSFARSLSLNNNNNNTHSNATKSLDFDYNNYHRQHHHNAHNHQQQQQQQQQSNCLPLPKRLERGATQNEVKSNGGGNGSVNINEVVNDDHDVGDDNHDTEVGVAKSTTPPPPALPVRRLIPATNNINSGNNKQHGDGLTLSHYEQEQLTQFRMSSSSSLSLSLSSSNTENINKIINQQLQQQQQMLPGNNNNNNNNGNNSHVVIIHGNKNLSNHRNPQQQQQQPIWPRDVINLQQIATNKNRNKCNDDSIKNIEPRPASAFELHENTLNVEAVILQNHVDTLQWQLKKVETSCEMYRAVMEEVARFLERYISHTQQRQQQQQQNRNEQQIARSKSLYHVHAGSNGSSSINNNNSSSNGGIHDSMVSGDETLSNSYLRTRSSSNLVGNSATNKSMLAMSDEHNYEPIAPANSYNAFKDFTWRRTPKKPTGRNAASLGQEDASEEKLNQEAFRLSRTIHNLLNTSPQQTDLTMPHRNSIAGSHSRLGKAASASIMTLPTANSTILGGVVTPIAERSSTGNLSKPCLVNGSTTNINNATAVNATTTTATDMLFLRSTNMRDSRLSLRSSTDSSVHSTISSAASSSSKIETDEEVTHTNAGYVVKPNGGSSTEDESGFSSISSFHDVGIPHGSTRMATSTPRSSKMNGLSLSEFSNNSNLHLSDNRNSTLKAAPSAPPPSVAATHPNNVIGLPNSSNVGGRWDAIGSATNASPSKTYRNAAKCQRFSTLSNEDSTTVLWV